MRAGRDRPRDPPDPGIVAVLWRADHARESLAFPAPGALRRPMARRSNRPRRSAPRHAPSKPVEVWITDLGAQGDGIALHEGQRLFVPGTLPGERVRAVVHDTTADGWRAHLDAVLEPAPDRVEPACPHFGACGGCTLQHMSPGGLAAWKRDQVRIALGRRGLDDHAPVEPVVSTPPGTRRRATLGWRRTARSVVVGFHRLARHMLEDITVCPLLSPTLVALLAPLRALLMEIGTPPTGGGHASLTETDTGIDMTLTLPASPRLAGLECLAAFARDQDLARLDLHVDGVPTPVAERRPPTVAFAGIPVRLPQGAFLQPSPEGTAAITRAVLDRVPPVGAREGDTTLDLFAGVGTLSLPLAMTGRSVHAVDSATDALAALAAARPTRGHISTEPRDLFTDPVQGPDLEPFGLVVFDPPRAGARAQTLALAEHGPARVVAVSCKASTFARDARILVDAGYRMGAVSPIDQFPWSAHMEMVAGFTRPS